jgi:hypothetical protein
MEGKMKKSVLQLIQGARKEFGPNGERWGKEDLFRYDYSDPNNHEIACMCLLGGLIRAWGGPFDGVNNCDMAKPSSPNYVPEIDEACKLLKVCVPTGHLEKGNGFGTHDLNVPAVADIFCFNDAEKTEWRHVEEALECAEKKARELENVNVN